MLKIIFLLALTSKALSLERTPLWGQCAGEGFTGDKNCEPGTTCVYVNQWYSQCQPSGLVTSTSAQVITSSLPISTSGHFAAKNGKLYDANGKEFLIRGVNSAHIWWDGWGRNYALNSLPAISATGSNTVRIVWQIKTDGGLDLIYLENIIKKCIENKMIPMIELHDATGSSNVQDLLNCAQWFKTNIGLFNKYQKYILINIANEWSPWGTALTVWRDAYKQAISIIRQSGWGGALVIDASAYAQNPDGPITYGKELVQSDPSSNLIFSVHMYSQWKSPGGDYKVAEKLAAIQNQGLTVIVGEFASTHPEGCNWIDIDAVDIITQCKLKNIGYLGWSWHGNGKGDCNSDLAPLNVVTGDASVGSTWTPTSYTNWGNILISTPTYGIKASSIRCSVFN